MVRVFISGPSLLLVGWCCVACHHGCLTPQICQQCAVDLCLQCRAGLRLQRPSDLHIQHPWSKLTFYSAQLLITPVYPIIIVNVYAGLLFPDLLWLIFLRINFVRYCVVSLMHNCCNFKFFDIEYIASFYIWTSLLVMERAWFFASWVELEFVSINFSFKMAYESRLHGQNRA